MISEAQTAAYIRWQNADAAWHAELVKVYGRDAANARYDYQRHSATPRLKELRIAKEDACTAYYATS